MVISARCIYCRKVFKSTNAVSRHTGRCAVKHGRQASRILRPPREDTTGPSQQTNSLILTDDGQQQQSLLATTLPNPDDDYIPILYDENAFAIDPTATQASDRELADAASATSSIERGRRTETYVSQRIVYSDSTARNVPSGGERAGRPAGQPITPSAEEEDTLDSRDNQEPNQPLSQALLRKQTLCAQGCEFDGLRPVDYSPFQSAHEWGLVRWFLKHKLSKGAIDDYLRDQSLNPVKEHMSFQNCDQMFDRIDEIKYGIRDDQWMTKEIQIAREAPGKDGLTCSVKYRSVLSAIRFLLNFPPFARHLHYAPEKHFDDFGDRVYHEMYTGDWWWNIQHEIDDPYATVVPLLVSSDKTLLTNHHGDQSAWAVYLTIGNLDRSVRLTYSLPGLIPIAFLPILKNTRDRPGLAHELYHKSMEIVFSEIKSISRIGVAVQCADGKLRRCYPLMAAFMADYPEQVLMTGVKQNEHCPSCLVPKEEFQVMYPRNPYPRRLHSRTLKQLARQSGLNNINSSTLISTEATQFWTRSRSNSDIIYDDKIRSLIHTQTQDAIKVIVQRQIASAEVAIPDGRQNPAKRKTVARNKQLRQQIEDEVRTGFSQDPKNNLIALYEQKAKLHKIRNFAWEHRLVDIHQAMAPDILHQLLKGHLDYLVNYIKVMVSTKESIGGPSQQRNGRPTYTGTSGIKRLDGRFSSVTPYHGLKIFNGTKHAFSEISQWTGDEQRAMVRQIVPVIAPLFLASLPEVILYARALVDFYIVATAKAHTEPQLRYMDDNLYTMDCTKWVFNEARRKSLKRARGVPSVTTQAQRRAHPVLKKRDMRNSANVLSDEGSSSDCASDTDQPITRDMRKPPVIESSRPSVSYNTPKTHALIHYTQWIRNFGSLDGYSTNRSEVGHKDEIKAYYGRTNKSIDFLDQLAHHSTRRFKCWAMSCLEQHIEGDLLTDAEQTLQSSFETSPLLERLDLNRLGLPLDQTLISANSFSPTPLKQWRHAKTIGYFIEVPEFLPAIATFVRQCRLREEGGNLSTHDLDRHIRDTHWASTMWVALHQGLRCRWSEGRNPFGVDEIVEQIAWCSNAWRNKPGKKRHDHVWVQEFEHPVGPDPPDADTVGSGRNTKRSQQTRSTRPFEGRVVARLVAVVSIIDTDFYDSQGNPIIRQGALLDVYRYHDNGRFHKIHGMAQVRSERNDRASRYRMYDFSHITRAVHLVPTQQDTPAEVAAGIQNWYINPYIDWDQYNTLYDPAFLSINQQNAWEAFTRNNWAQFTPDNIPQYRHNDI